MKIEIDKEGVMVITPKTIKEDEKLHGWYIQHGAEQCMKVIKFKRHRKRLFCD